MPTYEYKCPKCGTEFEAVQKMSAKPVAKCPKCGAKAVRLMSVGAGLVFKGSGFYLTDYGRSGQKAKTAEGEKAAAAGGEKPGGEKSGGDKSSIEKSGGDKPVKDKPAAEAAPPAPKSKSRKKDD
jgi:putative FmdB family regulatory protein